ncbi:UDP-N-acetylglucosamine--N-acetylmuramyl-(pentapeptide) pyrophosphoryl-undecaprenol N-acetylglucosamine transferase [Nymphon striatum]|nr:UDP-N-acetylglucosamine--N-acetylmuramyl-(pentapeptide) pyrophosphoryl-undecaprenol N-acetylglucosamine transferase [Nymphon striatum]
MVMMLCFIGGYPFKYLMGIVGAGLLAFTFFILVAKAFPDAFANRVDTWENRYDNFMNGEDTEADYQIEKAKIAIATGGVMGKGAGKSIQKNFLPQSSSDFIYAIIVEEYGLIGGVLLMLFFLFLLFRIVVIANGSHTTFGMLLALGVGLPIIFQALINMAVAVELFPVTGGHIYPAIAIANELKKRHPDAQFLFVGAEDRMEMEKVPQAGYKIIGLQIAGFQRKLTRKNLSFPFKLIKSLRKAGNIVSEFKPDVVIGTGGFASGPVLKVASGSRRINQLIESKLEFFKKFDIQVIWQCGKLYYEEYKKYQSDTVKVEDFMNRMDFAYTAADMIISRAGAGSVSELSIVGKPTIFIPSPNVAEDHQTKNAQALVDENAAILIKENDLDADFEKVLEDLFLSQDKQVELGANLKKLALPKATEHIVDEIEKLLN